MQNNDIAAISARLKELRTFSDYSTAEVAAKLGIDEAEYIAYETGEREIPINLIYKFASIMDTEAAYVVSGVMPSKERCTSSMTAKAYRSSATRGMPSLLSAAISAKRP